MQKKKSFIPKVLLILVFMLIPGDFSLCNEIYLFENGKSLIITDVPAPGYKKKIEIQRTKPLLVNVRAIPESYEKIIDEISAMYSVSPMLVKAVIQVESAYDSRAVSPKGAKGLMQLINGTAERFGVRDVFDPYENIRGGVKYLRHLLDYFGGDLSLALAAYNAGEKAVMNFGGVPPYAETINYVKNVKRLLGFSDSRRAKKQINGEAAPYISFSSGGNINIVN